eukprot:1009894_1
MVCFETRDIIFALVVLALIVDDSQQAQPLPALADKPKLELEITPLQQDQPTTLTISGEFSLHAVSPPKAKFFGFYRTSQDLSYSATYALPCLPMKKDTFAAELKLESKDSGSVTIQEFYINGSEAQPRLTSKKRCGESEMVGRDTVEF